MFLNRFHLHVPVTGVWDKVHGKTFVPTVVQYLLTSMSTAKITL